MPRIRLRPTLQRKLLAWLLGPLLGLLVLDTAATYSTSLRLFQPGATTARWKKWRAKSSCMCRPGPRRGRSWRSRRRRSASCCIDQDDRALLTRCRPATARCSAAIRSCAPPPPRWPTGKPLFYGDLLHGEPVRVVAAWMTVSGDAGAGRGAGAGRRDAEQAQPPGPRHPGQRVPAAAAADPAAPALRSGSACRAACCRCSGCERAVSDRSHLDLSPIEASDVPGEVMPLVEEVNDLLLRLGKTLDFQNRFIADAAHQLQDAGGGHEGADRTGAARERPGPAAAFAGPALSSAPTGCRAWSASCCRWRAMSRARSKRVAAAGAGPECAGAGSEHGMGAGGTAAQRRPRLRRRRRRRSSSTATPPAARADQQPDRQRGALQPGCGQRHGPRGGARRRRRQLSISDDGPRIPVEERERIFQRFHRLLGSQVDGSGLGLAIVSEIAALHSARITLEEDLDGVGNTFTVFFPEPEQRRWSPTRRCRTWRGAWRTTL